MEKRLLNLISDPTFEMWDGRVTPRRTFSIQQHTLAHFPNLRGATIVNGR